MSLDEMAAKALGVTSFTAVGHLLHINLKDHLIQQKEQIGKALLSKNSRALAVVNKINSIDSTYRNFEIEVIAKREGCDKSDDELMIVEVNENKCRFKFDFSKVYWNSRLSTEHERIINKLHKSVDIVFDLFAGVGPFSVPAAKAKCKTYANDLNPVAIQWLNVNRQRNKVREDMLKIYNKDAKDYILDDMKSKLLEEYKRFEDEELATKPKIHILMNLPALAPTFLQYLVGLFRDHHQYKVNDRKLIEAFREQSLEHIVYCYCFLKGYFTKKEAEDAVKNMIEEHIGRELTTDQLLGIFRVRNVAPYKEMYRVEIRLDEDLLFHARVVVGIMKAANNRLSINGCGKKVTINAPSQKRLRDDASSSLEEIDTKKVKMTDYCSII